MNRPYALFPAVLAALAGAQSPPADQAAAEVSSHDTPATFRTKVNLVLVPVVVRDAHGHAVGNLRKENFQIFDKSKQQVIASFSVEKTGGQAASPEASPEAPPAAANPAEASPAAPPAAAPDRFVAYLFDDVHLNFGDLAQARAAAERHLNGSLAPADRVAVFSTSGRTMLDFTDDRDQIHDTLARLRPQPIASMEGLHDCPDIDYYQADLIQNKSDPIALEAAVQEDQVCHPPPQGTSAAQALLQGQLDAKAAASRVLPLGDHETRVTLSVLKDAVRRIAAMPGQRTIVLISPGFLTLFDVQQDKADIIDRAIRGNVIVSSLNARGLYTIMPGGDASQSGPISVAAADMKSQYASEAALAEEETLA